MIKTTTMLSLVEITVAGSTARVVNANDATTKTNQRYNSQLASAVTADRRTLHTNQKCHTVNAITARGMQTVSAHHSYISVASI